MSCADCGKNGGGGKCCANTEPRFTARPLRKGVRIGTVANTSRDGTGNIQTIVEPGENGCRVDGIIFKSIVTTTAGMVRIYLLDTNVWTLIGEVTVAAITASGTVAAWEGAWTPTTGYITLEFGQHIGASMNAAESVVCHPEGGHY